MKFDQPPAPEQHVEIDSFAPFDMEFFNQIKGEDDWIAIGQEFYKNQRYFTIMGNNGEKLGIIGVYDTNHEQNITHTVIDPKFRGQGLAARAKEKLVKELGLRFITLTIDLKNESSIKAAKKMRGIKRISDKAYEEEFHKAKYIYEVPNKS